jgi:putative hydrolases of HD superfamily
LTGESNESKALLIFAFDFHILGCIKMALVHDIAESIIGDITPSCPFFGQKNELEQSAMTTLSNMVIDNDFSGEMMHLWVEYPLDASPEARLVKDIDKFEFLLQLVEYEKRYPDIQMNDFWESAKEKIRQDTMKFYRCLKIWQ